LDITRLGGVNEIILCQLLAKKFGKPVCLHGGCVCLSEMSMHLAIFDYVAVSADLTGRWMEYQEGLQAYYKSPMIIKDGKGYPSEGIIFADFFFFFECNKICAYNI